MTVYNLSHAPSAHINKTTPSLTWAELLISRLTVLYLATFIFEGALRFVLSKLHLTSALYLRDLLPVAAVMVMLTNWIGDRRQPSILLLAVLLLTFHFFIGFFFIGRLFQQLFGIKLLMPLVLGLAVGHLGVTTTLARLRWYAVAGIVILLIGLAINYKFTYPWEGAESESMFGVSQQSKSWTAGSVRRLAGLSRSSYDAACALLYCSVIALAAFRSVILRIFLWLLAFIGIALTTSKGVEVSMLALAGIVVASDSGRRIGWLRFALLGSVFLVVVAPALAILIDVRVRDFAGSAAWWFSSYADRMQNTWPRAIKLLLDHGNIILGRGIGGVGTPQGYGEARLYSPADNIFIYWTLSMGMLGWLYAGAIITKLLSWQGSSQRQRMFIFGFFISTLIYGVAANIMEQPLCGFGLGYAIALLYRPRTLSGFGEPVNVL